MAATIEHITLQFICGRGLASQTIAWFSSGHLSHVDYVMDNGMLLGARSDVCAGNAPGSLVPPGVQIRPATYVPKKEFRAVMRVPCTVGQKKSYEAFLSAQIGKPYDHLGIFAFFVDRDWRDGDSWFCSELQACAGERSGIFPNKLYLDCNKVTPVACALAYSAVGGVVQ